MRNPVACVSCRTAKRQCIHKNKPPCDRCRETGKACYFPPPGTSALHRQSKQRRATQRTSSSGGQTSSLSPHAEDAAVNQIGSQVSQLMRSPPADEASKDLSAVNPFELFTDEVKNSYCRCQYKWSFHHIPSLLIQVRNGTLDVWVIWAILALAIRFSNKAPAPFETPIEASNAYAAHARHILQPSIESPTLGRIQALLMVTGHSWGAGEGRRAWIHLGMAVRMGQILGIFDESTYAREFGGSQSREHFIAAEEKRRTAWTCFLMDSLLSGGKGRKRSLGAEDMEIQLPCETDRFNFGEAVRCERLNGTISGDHSNLPVGSLGIIAYSMRAADIWGAVARWACSSKVNDEPPWQPTSEFQHLLQALYRWRCSLPDRLQYSVLSLHAHSASEQGQAYCYMHSIYFMSVMFLHRSYLPDVGPQKRQHPGSPADDQWRQWQMHSRRELLQVAARVCEMLEEIRAFGLFFLRGLVPWIGFTIYTAVGVMLYCYHFPDQDDEGVMKRAKDRVVNGVAFLKDMRGQWPMADTWHETIKRMQAFYSNIKTKGDESVSRDERREIRNAIIDYGALQPSPVQDNHSEHSSSDAEAAASASSNQNNAYITVVKSDSSPPDESILGVQTTPTMPMQQQGQQPQGGYDMPLMQDFLPDDLEMFDTDFTIHDADLEAMIADATQGFWMNFPGEVGLY
ncbi:hypothetical protein K402DRAFT_175832 [Aulographum hederae CBS 113979]|uniref:Zn(2)-C6 fungal-type domain-containing protein n=1 Tax=Aulographum hederae CBS 113979 TaxID=1176131 RepID=A0A6G1GQM8_9PEZI|nr:hypothetical protein K402DRAFT_175832 [Aulographum hederae CBS 113979]